MKRSVEDKEWPVPQPVISKLGPFKRLLFMDNNPGTGMRGGANRIVDQPGGQHLFGRQKCSQFANVVTCWAMHAALSNMKSRSVGKNSRFHRELGGIRERSHLSNILVILLCEPALCFWSPVMIDHALDVSRRHGSQPYRAEISEESHSNSRLVSVRVGIDDASPLRFHFEDRPQKRIEFTVHDDYVLSMIESLEHRMDRGFDRASDFHDHINRVAIRKEGGFLGEHSHSTTYCGFR